MAETYYKVIVDNASAHGGDFDWTAHLPRPTKAGAYRPGKWTPTIPTPVICERGWHLTTDPMRWPKVGMQVYEAKPGRVADADGDKIVTDRCRLLRPAPETIPDWWHAAERFIREEIPATPWFHPDWNPDPSWRLFTAPTWDSARDSAWDSARDSAWASARDSAWDSACASARDSAWASACASAWDSAWDSACASACASAWDSAWDSALYVVTEHICAGLPLAEVHRAHARARWDVWRKGYALLCDVAGTLYVYAKARGA